MTAGTVTADKGAPTRKASYGSMSRDRTWALRWSYFFLVIFAAFFLLPPIYMFITSLKTSAEISAATNPWWVYNPTLSNYAELLTKREYLIFFRNSVIVSVFVVTITMLISIPAAFALSRMRFWGSATLATGVFLTYLVPDTLLFIPLFKMFAVFHEVTGIQLLNRWWVLLVVYPTLTVPFCTWIMIGYFASIPKELDEAAIIDGATAFQLFRLVYLPLITPAMVAIGIYAVLLAWNEYLYAFLLMSKEKDVPLSVALGLFLSADDSPWELLMATGFIYALPPAVIYYVFKRYMVGGLTAGAVKA